MSYATNKGANQPAYPHSLISTFVVRCLDSIIPLVSISEISSLYLASMTEQASLSLPWSHTRKTGFLMTWLKCRLKAAMWFSFMLIIWYSVSSKRRSGSQAFTNQVYNFFQSKENLFDSSKKYCISYLLLNQQRHQYIQSYPCWSHQLLDWQHYVGSETFTYTPLKMNDGPKKHVFIGEKFTKIILQKVAPRRAVLLLPWQRSRSQTFLHDLKNLYTKYEHCSSYCLQALN